MSAKKSLGIPSSEANAEGRAVIAKSYFDLVTAAYDSLGTGRLDEFQQSTVANNLPLKNLDLVRLDEQGQPKS